MVYNPKPQSLDKLKVYVKNTFAEIDDEKGFPERLQQCVNCRC